MKRGLFSENQLDKQFTLRSVLDVKEKLIEELRNKSEVRMHTYAAM